MGVFALVEIATRATLIKGRKTFRHVLNGQLVTVFSKDVCANPSAWEVRILHVENKGQNKAEKSRKLERKQLLATKF